MKITLEKIKKRLNYYFVCPGLAFDNNMVMTLDNKYCLHRIEHPPCPLFIVPIKSSKLEFDMVTFYADCLAYLHDIPFNLSSIKQKSPIKPIISYSRKENDYFGKSVEGIYESIVDLRLNGYFWFKWPEAFTGIINIDLHKIYEKAIKEIKLYSMALKQSDPLTEFLCYYRVIESISDDNGKKWIKVNLSKIKTFNFGFIQLQNICDEFNSRRQRRNLFTCYKRKALGKISKLNKSLSSRSIDDYLYSDIRCGIAHGKRNLRLHDYALHLKDISESLFIIKLLARIAIESKIAN